VENIHRCTRMPADERLLVTGGEVWKLIYVPGKHGVVLTRMEYVCCPYCGALLKEVEHGERTLDAR